MFFQSASLIFLAFFLNVCSIFATPISICQRPYAVAYTPNSVLNTPPPTADLRYAGERPRYSTCGGVAWIHGNQNVFAVNMQTSSVQVYTFSEDTHSLNPVSFFNNAHGMGLDRPEGLFLSKNEKYLVIPNMRNGKVQVYTVNPETFINPIPIATIQDYQVHGAQFSPDCKHLVFVTIGDHSKIALYGINKNNGDLTLSKTQIIKNPMEPIRPKGIAFSPDGNYVVIGYCMQLSNQVGAARAVVASYKFNAADGTIDPTPISVCEGLFSAECVAFYPDSSCFFAVDQVTHRVTGHQFDPETGEIGNSWVAIGGPESELSFPHGMAFTNDGRFVAVSNYGDDKVTIYAVE